MDEVKGHAVLVRLNEAQWQWLLTAAKRRRAALRAERIVGRVGKVNCSGELRAILVAAMEKRPFEPVAAIVTSVDRMELLDCYPAMAARVAKEDLGRALAIAHGIIAELYRRAQSLRVDDVDQVTLAAPAAQRAPQWIGSGV